MRLKLREAELLAGHGADWASALPAWARKEKYEFRRGFVDWLEMTGTEFLRHAESLFRKTPLATVRLRNVPWHQLREVMASGLIKLFPGLAH